MRERFERMHRRVVDALRTAGLRPRAVQTVAIALHASLDMRDRSIADDHNPAALHPARSILILVTDASILDASTLAAAALLDSVTASYEPHANLDALRDAIAQAASIPTPLNTPHESLLEELLLLPRGVVAAAIAERIDHARHLHFTPRSGWSQFIQLEDSVYVPLAARYGDVIGRRYARWRTAFENRLRTLPE